MKIALPSRDQKIDDHFGHCAYFTVYTVDTTAKSITSEEEIASPEGCGCKSNIAYILADQGVSLMLAGNMGEGAVRVLNSVGIDVVRGCSGDLKTVADNWLQGNIADSNQSCSSHGHDCNH